MKSFYAGAIYAGANIAAAAVPFALLPLLTRILTPADYGHIVAFSLLVTLCMPFAGLSVHSAVGVAWFNKPRKEISSFNGTALTLILITTALTAPVVVLVIGEMPSLVADLPAVWGAIAALTAGANVILQCRLVLWQSQGRAWNNAVLQVAASVLNVGLSLTAVLILGWGADGRNAGIAFSSTIMALVAFGLFAASRDAIWSFRPGFLLEQIRYGMPLVPHVLAGVALGTIDRWMVSSQLGAHALGLYGAVAQLGMMMTILADAFVKAYNPWLYAKLASTDVSDKMKVVGVMYVALPAFLILALAIGVFLRLTSGLLLGPNYAGWVTHMLRYFLLGGAFTGLYYCTASIYFFSGRTGLLASCTACAAVIGAVPVYFLVSSLGVQGGAIGFAVMQGLLALFATVTAFRVFDLPWFDFRGVTSAVLRSFPVRIPFLHLTSR
jgi:O-antigen/teichoic acid export membrane protein